MRNPFHTRFLVCLTIAILLHLAFAPWIPLTFTQHSTAKQATKTQWIYPIQQKSQKQVVSIPKKAHTENPNKARYLAEQANKTNKETVSKHAELKPSRITNEPSLGQSNQVPRPPPLLRQRQLPIRKGSHKKRLTLQDLLPTANAMALEGAQGAPFADHLEGMEKANETSLNAFEWKYATFFNRIKESIARQWDPKRSIQRFDPEGAMIGKQDRITILTVTIDPEGKLKTIQLKEKSGVGYLDDEAIRSFKEGGPFPHPPAALFKHKKEYSFDFGFFIDVEQGFRFDLNWAPN